jgi:hypothetical protein
MELLRFLAESVSVLFVYVLQRQDRSFGTIFSTLGCAVHRLLYSDLCFSTEMNR